jgi:hypothetical protein
MSEADGLDAVRRDAAAARGLDEAAVAFLHGETVDEIESSADRFATLLGKRETSEQEPGSVGDLLAGATRAKQERRDALVDVLVGRAVRPRDESGRFASGFDGGARESNVAAEPETHDHWLGRVLRDRSADVGARGF